MWACSVDPTSFPGSAGAMSIVGKWADGCTIFRLPDGGSHNTAHAHSLREHQGDPTLGQNGTVGRGSYTPQASQIIR